MEDNTPPPPDAVAARTTYRHGDLRRALLEAGVELARAGGPDAVVLREATRRAGVVPNAAYRHFVGRDGLLRAVRAAALAAAAEAIESEIATLPPASAGLAGDLSADSAQAHARATVRAVGTGYMRFALAEPGLFRTAFLRPPLPLAPPDDPAMAGRTGLNPLQLLGTALDQMVATGAMPADRRVDAEYVAWSSVHGLALLIIDGPLFGVPAAYAEALGAKLLDMVERGL